MPQHWSEDSFKPVIICAELRNSQLKQLLTYCCFVVGITEMWLSLTLIHTQKMNGFLLLCCLLVCIYSKFTHPLFHKKFVCITAADIECDWEIEETSDHMCHGSEDSFKPDRIEKFSVESLLTCCLFIIGVTEIVALYHVHTQIMNGCLLLP